MGTPVWKGTLTVGVVSLPMKMFKAQDAMEAKTNDVHGDSACYGRVGRQSFCYGCNKAVSPDEVVRGVRKADGTYLVIQEAELDAIKPVTSRNIAIDAFVPLSSIDPIYIDSSYYLEADGNPDGYAHFHHVLKTDKLAMQGRFTIYGRERTVTIRALGNGLVLDRMLSEVEIRSQEELPGYIAPGAVTLNPEMVNIARQLAAMYQGTFDPTEYEDEYQKNFTALVASKLNGTAAPVATVSTPTAPTANLMDALKASLKGAPVVAKKTKAAAKPVVVKEAKPKKGKK
jgi:DNA end-binding protein Ku